MEKRCFRIGLGSDCSLSVDVLVLLLSPHVVCSVWILTPAFFSESQGLYRGPEEDAPCLNNKCYHNNTNTTSDSRTERTMDWTGLLFRTLVLIDGPCPFLLPVHDRSGRVFIILRSIMLCLDFIINCAFHFMLLCANYRCVVADRSYREHCRRWKTP